MSRCGVICFFRAQVHHILAAAVRSGLLSQRALEALQAEGGSAVEERDAVGKGGGSGGSLQVATVDAFQGAEKNVIVLSTAVTSRGR